MTAIDENTPTTNGHIPSDAAGLPLKDLRLPTGGVPRWGTPPAGDAPAENQDDDFDGLAAGDEASPQTGAPVDQHLIVVKPTPGQRLAALDSTAPVAPGWLTDPQIRREKVARGARRAGRGALLIGVNAPKFTALIVWWTLRGWTSTTWRVLRWALDVDGHPLLGDITAKDDRAYVVMTDRRTRRQKFRFGLLGVAAFLLAVAVLVLWLLASWTLLLLAALAVALLGRAGKPEDVKILSPRIAEAVAPRLTAQAIARALAEVSDAKTGKAIREDSTKLWRSAIVDVRGGHKVWIQLPGSAVAADLVPFEQRLASALGRPEDTVIVEQLNHITTGDLNLWVFDKPQLTGDVGAGPLPGAKKTSWWAPVQVGVTRLGQSHREHLQGGAWFVGGRPSSGKSSLCRIAAAHTALDPNALLIIVNLKGSPDYHGLQPVCHRYICDSPESSRTVVAEVAALTQWLLDEAAGRNEFLKRLVEKGQADSNDVTEELSRKHRELRPITVILDEVHRMFDESDNPDAKAYAELLGKVIKAVRSVAITVIGATQLAGTESVPPVITRAARLRGCLKVTDATSFRQIFGDAGQGAFAAAGVARFKPGTVLLAANDGSPLKVGALNITPAQLRAIGKRALELRTALHTLTGEAAGEQARTGQAVDPAVLLQHLLAAIPTTAPAGGPDDEGVAWVAELEALLDGREEYASRATGWLPGELRTRAVTTGQLNRRILGEGGETRQRNQAGVRASDVREALERLLSGE